MSDWADHFMTDEMPAIRDHFDNQIAALRSLVEASAAKQDANHHMQVAAIANVGRDLSEVKGDVKHQNGRVGKLETDVAFIKGQKSGAGGTFTAIVTAISAAAGAGGVLLAAAMAGR